MRSGLMLFCSLFFSVKIFAQHKLTINVKKLPATHQGDRLFVAGNFNGWAPDKTEMFYNTSSQLWTAQLAGLSDDVYEFKFTRGSWDKVQAGNGGADVSNNLLKLRADTNVTYDIIFWKDDAAVAAPRPRTASAHVSVIDTAFSMPQLKTKRRVWIYLPEGYAKSKQRYPVLYMHDGQNLFDESASAYGEWGVDECLDSMIAKGKPAAIVVGIDNGPRRINEYDPYSSEKYGKGEGDQYVDFITETLKPFIDKHYRTLEDKGNTIIAGSSMGGLISFYAMLKYPEVYGKAGVFSPAFWIAPEIHAAADSLAGNVSGKIFFYAGDLENESMVPDMQSIADHVGERSKAIIYSVVDPEGRHNEAAWRKWFAAFYLWVMGEGNNVIVE